MLLRLHRPPHIRLVLVQLLLEHLKRLFHHMLDRLIENKRERGNKPESCDESVLLRAEDRKSVV